MNAINAIILKVRSHLLGNEEISDTLTAEVTTNHCMSRDAAKVKLSLFCPSDVRPLLNTVARARRAQKKGTLPWGDGQVLVASGRLSAAMSDVQSVINEFNKLRDTLCEETNYAAAIERAKAMRNGTFRMEDYPANGESARAEFALEMIPLPLPSVDHLPTAELKELYGATLQHEVDRQVEERVADKLRGPLGRFVQILEGGKAVKASSLRAIRATIAAIPDEFRSAQVQATEAMIRAITPELLADAAARQRAKEELKVQARAFNSFGRLGNRKLEL